MLLEDSLVLGDAAAVAGLLGGGAVFGAARGASAVAAALLARGPAEWVDVPHVLQARDLALLGAPAALPVTVAVARRGPDRLWRYEILSGS
jgi:hypothetical protein